MSRATRLLCGLLLAVTACPAQPPPFLTWRPGDAYFRLDGTPSLVLGRNPVAVNIAAWTDHFQHMAAAGERLARIHFCFQPPNEPPGTVQPGLLAAWDAALDAAERNHIAVLPVLGIWSSWNDGSGGQPWHGWERNPYNAARGGPARTPAELFADGPCRTLWLRRLQALVEHWQPRRCIVAWETFSELDLVTGANEAGALAFHEAAAGVIRAADPAHRPITVSLSGGHDWPALWRSPATDLAQVHPYGHGPRGDLDLLILQLVQRARQAYGKPVLLGECGLDWAPPRGTLDTSERAPIALRHAVWAALVSGAMNARMLWWQDGYDQFEQADLCRHYQQLAVTAAKFVEKVDCGGLAPTTTDTSPGLRGAALAGEQTILGWFRDGRCAAPNWPTEPTTGQWVELPARGGPWRVELIDPESGQLTSQGEVAALAGKLRLALPEFRGSVGVRARKLGAD